MTGRLPKFAEAAKILRTHDGDPRTRLADAGHEFWSALFDRDRLPSPFCSEADEIAELLLLQGRIERTVADMDEATLSMVADRIIRFADDLRTASII